mmetsp:Transcript_30355/g.86899  ORF Transcript_30355/g.86899 Transcript_30355/m.86899 type:complete len:202 (-) Transcript_30355:2-607(-)
MRPRPLWGCMRARTRATVARCRDRGTMRIHSGSDSCKACDDPLPTKNASVVWIAPWKSGAVWTLSASVTLSLNTSVILTLTASVVLPLPSCASVTFSSSVTASLPSSHAYESQNCSAVRENYRYQARRHMKLFRDSEYRRIAKLSFLNACFFRTCCLMSSKKNLTCAPFNSVHHITSLLGLQPKHPCRLLPSTDCQTMIIS